MARTNWKKTELQKRDLLIACLREDLKDAVHSRSALKGQLTRCKNKLVTERAANTEARELVELLEWAKKNKYRYTSTSDGYVLILSFIYPWRTIAEAKKLLLALRAAKKIVEGEK